MRVARDVAEVEARQSSGPSGNLSCCAGCCGSRRPPHPKNRSSPVPLLRCHLLRIERQGLLLLPYARARTVAAATTASLRHPIVPPNATRPSTKSIPFSLRVLGQVFSAPRSVPFTAFARGNRCLQRVQPEQQRLADEGRPAVGQALSSGKATLARSGVPRTLSLSSHNTFTPSRSLFRSLIEHLKHPQRRGREVGVSWFVC